MNVLFVLCTVSTLIIGSLVVKYYGMHSTFKLWGIDAALSPNGWLDILQNRQTVFKSIAKRDKHVVYSPWQILNSKFVFICSSKAAKQVLRSEYALLRPAGMGKLHKQLLISSMNDVGSWLLTDNSKWQKRRKISKLTLFRTCNTTFVAKVLDETLTNVVMKELNKLCDANKLWYPSSLIFYCFFNTMFYANCGHHIAYNDPLCESVENMAFNTFRLITPSIVYQIFPEWLLHLLKLFPNSDCCKILKQKKESNEIMKKLLKKIKKLKKKDNEKFYNYVHYKSSEITNAEILADLHLLINAGTHAPSVAVEFAIIWCCKYQDIQNKIRAELIECYDKNNNNNNDNIRRFNMNWINQLTQFRAFIYESLRVSGLIEAGIPRLTTENIDINLKDENNENKKYVIPKGSIIIWLIELMHKNHQNGNNSTENWLDSSENICLENWINPITKQFEMNKSFALFGYGKRDCIGKDFARKHLYIIMAHLLLNYSFSFKLHESNKEKEINVRNVYEAPGTRVSDSSVGIVVKRWNE